MSHAARQATGYWPLKALAAPEQAAEWLPRGALGLEFGTFARDPFDVLTINLRRPIMPGCCCRTAADIQPGISREPLGGRDEVRSLGAADEVWLTTEALSFICDQIDVF